MRLLRADFTKSSPLYSDFLSATSAGEEREPVVILLIHSPHFHLQFSQRRVLYNKRNFCS